MEVSVIKNNGKDSGRKVTLSDSIFNIDPNDHAIYLDVKQFMANQRQGTHKTLEKSEVSGSTKKLKRQKGTGGARAGSIKSPLFPGGARVFGPKPRDYSFKLNKKVKILARKSALSYKAKSQEISVVEDFNFEKPKTSSFAKFLKDIKLDHKKTLLVIPAGENNVVLSSRNIKNSKVVTAESLNTYELLHADNILFFESSLENVEKVLS
jgi:large subunit ribosomal protein L4